MGDTDIPGWDDVDDIEPDDVPVPGTRPRVEREEMSESEPAIDKVWPYQSRVYQIGERTIELYPIAVLMEVTGFSYAGIRKWEKDGTFPRARYRSPRKGKLAGHRLYTRRFIEGVRDLLKAEQVSRTFRNIHQTDFTRRVHILMQEAAE